MFDILTSIPFITRKVPGISRKIYLDENYKMLRNYINEIRDKTISCMTSCRIVERKNLIIYLNKHTRFVIIKFKCTKRLIYF